MKNEKLLVAAENGHKDIVSYLLEKGANINAKNNNDETALMYASENGHFDVVVLLIENGADVNCKDCYFHETAVSLAAENGDTEITELLSTFNPKAVNKEEITTLEQVLNNGLKL